MCPGGLPKIVVAGVPDDEADIVTPGKLYSGLNVGNRRRVYRVCDLVSEGAWRLRAEEWVAAIVGELVGHRRRRRGQVRTGEEPVIS